MFLLTAPSAPDAGPLTVVVSLLVAAGSIYFGWRKSRVDETKIRLDENKLLLEAQSLVDARAKVVDDRLRTLLTEQGTDIDRLRAENEQDRQTMRVQGEHLAAVEHTLASMRMDLALKTSERDEQLRVNATLQTDLAAARAEIATLKAQADVWRAMIADLRVARG